MVLLLGIIECMLAQIQFLTMICIIAGAKTYAKIVLNDNGNISLIYKIAGITIN